jgi:metal-sulfur cluster biosynthetic enzyme
MKETIQARIDAVFAKVKEPQSLVSLVDLGLIERVHYSEAAKQLTCHLAIGTPRFQCPACSAINGVVKQGLVRELESEFTLAFPGWTIAVQ